MIIETRYNLGDTVWYFTKDGIDNGVIDSIETNTYTWLDIFGENSKGKEEKGPNTVYKMEVGKFGNTGKYREDQLWRTREEMPI